MIKDNRINILFPCSFKVEDIIINVIISTSILNISHVIEKKLLRSVIKKITNEDKICM